MLKIDKKIEQAADWFAHGFVIIKKGEFIELSVYYVWWLINFVWEPGVIFQVCVLLDYCADKKDEGQVNQVCSRPSKESESDVKGQHSHASRDSHKILFVS